MEVAHMEEMPSVLRNGYRPKIVRGRLSEQVAEQLQEWILSGELQEGCKLPPERELGRMFGVSRIVLREATHALVERGLLSVEPGRGSFVVRPTANSTAESIGVLLQAQRHSEQELLEVRRPLEIAIAAWAAQRARPEHLLKMRRALEEMDANTGDLTRYVEADLAFHMALAEATENPLFLTLLNPLIGLLRESRKRTVGAPGATGQAQEYHWAAYYAVEQRDADAASRAIEHHMEQIAHIISTGSSA